MNDDVKIGIVFGCEKLNVRIEPRTNAPIVCKIPKGSEVMIDDKESSKDFYKVFTSAGIDGFCMKSYIQIQN